MRILSSSPSSSTAATNATSASTSSAAPAFKDTLTSAENATPQYSSSNKKADSKSGPTSTNDGTKANGSTKTNNSSKKDDRDNVASPGAMQVEPVYVAVSIPVLTQPIVLPAIISKKNESANETGAAFDLVGGSSSSNETTSNAATPHAITAEAGQVFAENAATASVAVNPAVGNMAAVDHALEGRAIAASPVTVDIKPDAPKNVAAHPESPKGGEVSEAHSVQNAAAQASPVSHAAQLSPVVNSPSAEQLPQAETGKRSYASSSALKPIAANTKSSSGGVADGPGNVSANGQTTGSIQTSASGAGTGDASSGGAGGDSTKSDFAAAVKVAEAPTTMQAQQQDGIQPVPQPITDASGPQQAVGSDPKPSSTGGEATAANASPTYVPTELSGLSSAQLVQSMHGSEMRIGMHSDEFGAMSINATVNHQALAAQLSFDHPELSRAMAVHVPAIEEKLGSAYGVSARVEVRDNAASSADTSQQSAGQQRDSKQNLSGRPSASSSSTLQGVTAPAAITPLTSTGSSVSMRLDVRI